jgi:predicted transcriptional regulator
MSLGHRSCRVLAAIAAQPGASNREVADAAEVRDEGQTSRLLARLHDLGLIHDPGQWRVGEPHSWRLTTRGSRAVRESGAKSERPWS